MNRLKKIITIKMTLLSVISLYLVSTSCKKQKREEPCETVNAAPQDFLKYWFLPEGSTWIYKLDSTEPVYDTLICRIDSSYQTKYPEYNYGLPRCVWRYSIAFGHSNKTYFPYEDTTRDRISEDIFYAEYGGLKWYLYHTGTVGYVLSAGAFLAYPFEQGSEVHGVTLDSFATVSMGAGTFDSTICITSKFEQSDITIKGKHFKKMYLSPGVGVVKITYTNGEEWELVSYHVKR